jgi:hypothetical protein
MMHEENVDAIKCPDKRYKFVMGFSSNSSVFTETQVKNIFSPLRKKCSWLWQKNILHRRLEASKM